MGYIYLIQEREFVRLEEEVYKLGRCSDYYNRLRQYPKGSSVILIVNVDHLNVEDVEKKLIDKFKIMFEQCKDYGNEYFTGDVLEMIREILAIV